MIHWFYPIIVLIAGATSIGRRESREHSPLIVGLLDSGFLLPWIASLRPDLDALPLLCLFLVAGSWLLLASRKPGKLAAEAFTKLALSWLLGFLFLLVPFLDPSSLLWPLSFANFPQLPPWLSVASIAVGLFLLWGLPPLQAGVVDAAEVWGRESHVRLSLGFRIALAFSLLVTLPAYLQRIPGSLLEIVASLGFIGLGLSRMVAGVQINVQRSLVYLSQGLILPVLMMMASYPLPQAFEIFAPAICLAQALIWSSLYTGFQISDFPRSLGWDDPEARMVKSLQLMPGRLRSVLHLESLVILIYSGTLAYFGNFRLLLPALFFILASQAVAHDEHAFAGRGQRSIS